MKWYSFEMIFFAAVVDYLVVEWKFCIFPRTEIIMHRESKESTIDGFCTAFRVFATYFVTKCLMIWWVCFVFAVCNFVVHERCVRNVTTPCSTVALSHVQVRTVGRYNNEFTAKKTNKPLTIRFSLIMSIIPFVHTHYHNSIHAWVYNPVV